MTLVEEAENPVDVASLLNPYLKKPFRIFNVLKICLRNSWKILYQVKSPDNFILYFVPLFYKEILKVTLIKNDVSMFLFIIHEAKVENVALK